MCVGPMILQKEVLPPRQVPRDPCDLSSDRQVRDALTRSIWISLSIVGLGSVLARLLETFL